MAIVQVRRFLNESKEGNFDLVDEYGHPDFLYVCYEVEVLVELNTETGESRIIGCEGKLLSDQDYST